MLKVKRLSEKAVLPVKGSALAAGYDIASAEDVIVHAGETVKVHTGLAFAPPAGYFVGIFARSGLATKHGLRPANCVGVCDEDYRGECIVVLHNDSTTDFEIHTGDRVAQIILLPYINDAVTEVDELDDTERGSDGFGSTGIASTQTQKG